MSNGWEVGGQGLISNTFLNQEFSKYSSEAIQRTMHLRRHRHLQEENKWVQFKIQKIPHGIEKVKHFQT